MAGSSAGALSRALDQWVLLVRNEHAIRIVRSGYALLFLTPPPLSRTPLAFIPPRDPVRFQVLQDEILSLLQKGAIREGDPLLPGFYANLFTVPKKNGGLRPVLDLSSLNEYLVNPSFKMETAASLRLAIRPGDWATSLDLQDAYFHVAMAESAKRFLRFVWEGQVYEFNVLPFGLATAPRIFTSMVNELALLVRVRGIRLRTYLDDWLTLARSRAVCQGHTDQVLESTLELGFRVNFKKSDLSPSQNFTYLGMKFDTLAYTVAPSDQRVLAFIKKRDLLLSQGRTTYRQLSALLGMMESMTTLLPLGRLFKRPLQFEVARKVCFPPDYNQVVWMGPWFRKALEQWLDPQWLHSSVPIQPPASEVYVYTDASTAGWGGHAVPLNLEASGLWSREMAAKHINLLELEAIRLVLLSLAPSLVGRAITVHGDNTTALAYLRNQGGTKSFALYQKASEILLWCRAHKISLSVQFVPGKLNVLADQLSRSNQILPTEWTICHSALQKVWARWSKPLVDLFATRYSSRLALYVSPVADPLAMATNAFAIPWTGLQAYAYPPTSLIPRVLAKYTSEGPTLLLVTPYWPKCAWFPELLTLACDNPLPLDLEEGQLVQPRSGHPHPNLGVLRLTAWRLCGQGCEHKV